MSEELKAEIFTGKMVVIGGFIFIFASVSILFVIIFFALKRKARKEEVLQQFLKENRSNGKKHHVEHGNADSKH